MKKKIMPLWVLGVFTFPGICLEAPQKIEPLAPNQAPAQEAREEAKVADAPAEPKPAPEPQAEVEKIPEVQNLRAYLGVGVDPVPAALADHLGLDAATCSFVRLLDPQGPAASAGLKEADIIMTVDGKPIKSQQCLSKLMEKHQAGDEVKISYMHRGKALDTSVKLGARPDIDVAGMDGAEAAEDLLPEEMLKGLPKEMRDAIEKNLQALGGMGRAQAQVMPMDANGMPELQKRVEKMMQGMQLQLNPGAPGVQAQMKSTLKMMDKEGNIEISRDGESCEAKVFDKNGELLWSGPYQTPQDKAAVPPPVRDRLDALNLDTTGKGIQLRMLPRR